MGRSSRKKKSAVKVPGSGRARPEDKGARLSPKTASWGTTLIAVSVAMLTFVIYLPALQNEFVNWDDDFYVYENSFIHPMNARFFESVFLGFHFYNWHPLTWISHAADYALWGLNPLGHHLTNVVLHALNTLLVVLLAAKLIEAVRRPSSGQEEERSSGRVVEWSGGGTQLLDYSTSLRFTLIAVGVTGLLFGLHPVHVESVAWVSERKDLLCGLFYLLTIMAYTKYAANAQATGQGIQCSLRALLPALCFFVLALLSKPMAVSLPFVLLLLDWHPFRRIISFRTARAALFEKIPFITLSLISSILTVMAQKSAIALRDFIPLSTRLLVAAESLATYLLKMILPFNLIPYYPYPKDISLLSLQFLLPCLLLIGITTICIANAGKRRLWMTVWLYYVITLLPVLGIVQVGGQAMADRYAYLPSVGPFLAMGLMAASIYGKAADLKQQGLMAKTACIGIAIIVCASVSYATVRQIGVWKNSLTLWNYVIEKEPGRVSFAYNNLGMAYQSKGLLDMAIEQYQKALTLKPDDPVVRYNLANTYRSEGLFDKAIEQYQAALTLKPDFVEAHTNLGNVYQSKGLFDRTIEQYQAALTLKPDDPVARYNLGNAYLVQGLFDKAIEQYREALRLKPDLADAYTNMGNTYQAKGEFELAIEQYRKTLTLKPDDALAHYNLGISYSKKGLKKRAIEEFKTTLEIRPDFTEGRQALESLTR